MSSSACPNTHTIKHLGHERSFVQPVFCLTGCTVHLVFSMGLNALLLFRTTSISWSENIWLSGWPLQRPPRIFLLLIRPKNLILLFDLGHCEEVIQVLHTCPIIFILYQLFSSLSFMGPDSYWSHLPLMKLTHQLFRSGRGASLFLRPPTPMRPA